MAKVCISGYYGHDSIGNELVLMSLVNALRRQSEDMEIVVFSADPEKTKANFEVSAVQEDQWETVKNEIKSADLLISGGGHLLKETADLKELKYYLKVMKAALRSNVPVYVFNQVIGPFTSSRSQSMVAGVMKKVSKITVADKESAELLQSMGIRRGRIHMMKDPVLTMTEFESEWNLTDVPETETKKPTDPFAKRKEKQEEAAKTINYDGMEVEIEIRIVDELSKKPAAEVPLETIAIPVAADKEAETAQEDTGKDAAEAEEKAAAADKKAAKKKAADGEAKEKHHHKAGNRPHNLGLVVPSFWKKPGEKFAAFTVSPRTELPVTQITAMADYMIDNGYQVVFLPIHYPGDVTLAKDILGMMKNKGYEVDGKMSPQSLLTAISEVDFVFSSEIYPLMMAAVCKKPFASLCFSTRAEDFVTSLGMTPTGSMLSYDGEAFIRNFKAAVADPDAIAAAIETNLPEVQEKASFGIDLLQTIFEQIERKKARMERAKAPRVGEEKEPILKGQALSFLNFGKKKQDTPEEEEIQAETETLPEEEGILEIEAVADEETVDEMPEGFASETGESENKNREEAGL